MAARSPRVLSCFSGVGGLDLAFRCVVPDARVVCYVEREVPAVAILAARMADGLLDPAPVWSDVRTVPGVVRAEWVVGGFPCQDLSSAGKGAGLGGERSGLFYAMLDAADRCGAGWLFMENVRAILTAAGASDDEDGGEVDDDPDAVRAVAAVLGELADRGWDAEWTCVRASDVGAPHGRDRWFGLAWRVGDSAGERRDGGAQNGRGQPAEVSRAGHQDVADRSGDGRERVWGARAGRSRLEDDGAGLADADLARREGRCMRGTGCPDECDPGASGGQVAHPLRDGLPRLEERDLDATGRLDAPRGNDAYRRRIDLPLFPPGQGEWTDAGGGRLVPLDRDAARWVEVLEARPDLAPAVEPAVCGVADGVAGRIDRLRACGNGVVVVQGALALVELLRRAAMNDDDTLAAAGGEATRG